MGTSAHMLAAVYPDRDHARTILDMLERMRRAGRIRLVDAALVTKDDQGKLHVEETKELTGRKGARRGAIIMGSLAILFPPSVIGSAIVGGGLGALTGRLHDSGVKNKQFHELAEGLEPGKAIVIALAEEASIATVQSALTGYDGTLIVAVIDEQTLDEMHRQAAIKAGSGE